MAENEEAVLRFLEGEEEAFNRIVRSWERKIYNLAWRMLGNREDAQDVVQETFLSIFKSIQNLRHPERFSIWLYQIALNHCRVRRRNRTSDRSLNEPLSDQVGEDVLATHFSSTPSPGATLETIDILRKALAGLSEDHRSAIILKEYVGLSLEEIANVMECPLSTAKSRLYHGLREVQQNLKRMGIKM